MVNENLFGKVLGQCARIDSLPQAKKIRAQSRNVVLDTFENALAKLLYNYIVNWNHGART